MPNKALLVNYINKKRSVGRPRDVTGISFEINMDHIPENFLRHDINQNNARHLIFMTEKQLEIMSTSKVWYLDGTFRIINRPFQQLFGIHCFVKSGDHIKQFPVCFVFMTNRRYEDYIALFTAIRRSLPRINLERCMLDYEKS